MRGGEEEDVTPGFSHDYCWKRAKMVNGRRSPLLYVLLGAWYFVTLVLTKLTYQVQVYKVCVFFTLNLLLRSINSCYFYPSTSDTPSIRVDASPLGETSFAVGTKNYG